MTTLSSDRPKSTKTSTLNTKQAEDEEKYNYLMMKNRKSPGPIYDNVNEEAISLLRKFPKHSFGKANRSGFYDLIDSPGPKYNQNNVLVSSMHAKPPTAAMPLAERQTGMTAGNNVGFHDTANYDKLSNKPKSPQRKFPQAARLESYSSQTPGATMYRYDITSDHRSTPASSFTRSARASILIGTGGGGGGGGGGGESRRFRGGGGGDTDAVSRGGEGARSQSSEPSMRRGAKYGIGDISYAPVLRKNPQVSFSQAKRMPSYFADSPGPAAHGNGFNPAKPSSATGTWSKEPRLGAAWLL